MRSPARRGTAAALAALGIAVVSAPAPAAADHTETDRITDDMPYILQPKQVRIGLWKAELGLWGNPVLDRIQIGTYVWPWLVWAWGAPYVDLGLKVKVIDHGPWAVSAGLRYLYLDLHFYEDQDGVLQTLPLEAFAGYRLGDVTFAAGAIYTVVKVDGDYDPDDGYLQGAAGVSNLQVPLAVEWRLGRRTTLSGRFTLVPFQATSGEAYRRIDVDARTTVEGYATGTTDALDPDHIFSVAADVTWSWSVVNLRLGAVYGNFTVPILNLVSPERHILPTFDIYARF